jgi:hypothetical protein
LNRFFRRETDGRSGYRNHGYFYFRPNSPDHLFEFLSQKATLVTDIENHEQISVRLMGNQDYTPAGLRMIMTWTEEVASQISYTTTSDDNYHPDLSHRQHFIGEILPTSSELTQMLCCQ